MWLFNGKLKKQIAYQQKEIVRLSATIENLQDKLNDIGSLLRYESGKHFFGSNGFQYQKPHIIFPGNIKRVCERKPSEIVVKDFKQKATK